MSTLESSAITRPAGTRAFIHAALLAASLPVLLICLGILNGQPSGSAMLILSLYVVGLAALGMAVTGLVKRLAGGAGEVVNLRRRVLLSFALPSGIAIAATALYAIG